MKTHTGAHSEFLSHFSRKHRGVASATMGGPRQTATRPKAWPSAKPKRRETNIPLCICGNPAPERSQDNYRRAMLAYEMGKVTSPPGRYHHFCATCHERIHAKREKRDSLQREWEEWLGVGG